MSSGYLVATFDLLNVRDLDVIEQAAARCDHLVVGLLSDEMVEDLSGRRPVVPLDERLRLVGSVRGVGQAVVHERRPHGGTATFVVAQTADVVSGPIVILESRRESRSEILREALTPIGMQAVA